MSAKYKKNQKQIYLKAYKNLTQLENALKKLKEEKASHFQVSILGKVSQFYNDKAIESSKDNDIIKSYWQNLLGKTVKFGSFYNSESRNVFITGALATTFLHKINGKSLATLSSGSYGIFRGIGVSEAQTTLYLKLLNSGNYLLILRGYDNEIPSLDTLPNKPIS